MKDRAPDAASKPRDGRIVTFYSYKGGTGRSMALANAAWILASQGKRVLAVDWDLEAPGLHRYFHPFLEDKELTEASGLIDYFYDVVDAARAAVGSEQGSSETSKPWWHEWTSWLRYTCSLDTRCLPLSSDPSAPKGSIDFVPAGKQGSAYGDRVSSFDWKSFYDRLGGGVLLEAVKKRLRERYDYVLIDSRTGISDASGICTVQMPDDLVVCFTLNKQSMFGAAAAARSAASQRTKEGKNGLRIWPVPTRIEMAERDRLEAARTTCRELFWEHLGPLLKTRADRPVYWGRAEVLYQPYFAYEEVLAVFSERRHQTASMLSSLEYLVSCFSDGDVTELADFDEQARADVMRRYVPEVKGIGAPIAPSGTVYISYRREEQVAMRSVNQALHAAGIDTWVDEQNVLPGSNWEVEMTAAQARSKVLLVLLGRIEATPAMLREIAAFLNQSKTVIPVLLGRQASVPALLASIYGITLSDEASAADYGALTKSVSQVLGLREPKPTSTFNPEDPQKGRWGGAPAVGGRVLSAKMNSWDGTFGDLQLSVSSTSGQLVGAVTFHLHPSFKSAPREVQVVDGVATLRLVAWGGFTVGAETDGGKIRLELDLAQDPSFPVEFRAR